MWGRRAHARLGFPLLVARNRRLGWDARRVRDAGGPVLCEVVTNVLWGLARLAMGEPSITPALVDRLWDERLRAVPRRGAAAAGRGRPVETWAALAPLALPDLPEAIGRRLVEEHLLDPRRFWLPVAPPSVSAAEPSFEPGRGRGLVRRYWRGPTWVNAAWLLWIGLMPARLRARRPTRMAARARRGDRAARACASTTTRAPARASAPRDFAWTSLALEMADPDPRAAQSYL